MAESNPLLDPGELPRFLEIRAEHVEPGIRELLQELETELDSLEANLAPGYAALVEPLERIGDRLHAAWGVVGHLMSVRNSEALRAAHEAVQPDVVQFSIRLGQSAALYRAARALRDSAEWDELDKAQRRVIEALIRDAELSGVGLQDAERERFNQIQLELAELQTRFSNNVLDATKAFAIQIEDAAELEGLPRSALELAAQQARDHGSPNADADSGPWRFTLDYPSLRPVLEHARNRSLRERMYRGNIMRASTGTLDNAPAIEKVLALRAEEATLLGFSSYAELSLASKMANGIDAVETLLERLRGASLSTAQRELEELRACAKEHGEHEALQHWDLGFWAERLREQRFAYSEEELRPYFPLPHVLDGLYSLCSRLFGLRIEPADGEAPVWHPDVRFFRVLDDEGRNLAAFYLDPYSRPAEKQGGAWMNECVARSGLLGPAPGQARLPVAYLVCNGTPPVGDRPSLMTFDEVLTLFHEFGHGLQHMLTTVDQGLCSGIRNVEWDAVELPSQFMENWCYHRETLIGLSRHVDTGEPLPVELFEKIRAARTFRAASGMLRQLYFAFTDIELHAKGTRADETPFDLQARIAEKTTVLPPLPEDRMLCSFSHIFAGGYAAGYYSYKWAEVLSADAFAAFEEAGLEDERALEATGRRYRDTVLALGGSRAPMEVFVEFRGREPTPDALLRHSGLL